MSQLAYDPPAECGRRLIPGLVDDIAMSDPQRPFVSVPRTTNLEDGYEDISYSAFAAAVSRCCWWIEKELGQDQKSTTLFYFGPLDIRYLIVLLAATKTGHKAFFSSHRNSLAAHLSLLEATSCRIILLPEQAPTMAGQIISARKMQVLAIPTLEYFMVSDPVVIYRWVGTFDEMKDETMVVLHTSGSTGTPKPVFVTHGTFACNDAHQLIPSLGGKPTTVHYISRKRLFLAFPLFHAANLTFTIGFAPYCGVVCVLPPPGPMTAEIVNMVHTYGNLNGSLIPPSIIIDIYKNSEFLVNMIRWLEFVSYVGGTLPSEIGDPISSRLRLITLMGSTETMLLPIELNEDNQDWQYLPISPYLGHEFRPARDGLRELVVVRNQKLNLFQGVFSTFPKLEEYPMKDLYEEHPTRPGSWVFRARADDIISFTNAEKLNPVTMEGIIMTHPAVNSAIIGGHGEFQAALLVEPKVHPTTEMERGRLHQEIWPVVVQANRDCPAHGRIMKDFIIITSAEKPLPRAGKDTVQRFAALELYAAEFRALFTRSKTRALVQDKSLDGARFQPLVRNGKLNDSSTVQGRLPLPQSPKSEAVLETNLAPIATETLREERCHDQSSVYPSCNIDSHLLLDDIDARIQATLHRVLPEVLLQHLGPALAQMMANLLRGPVVSANALNQVIKNHVQVSSQAKGTYHAGSNQANGTNDHRDSTLGASQDGVTEKRPSYQNGDTEASFHNRASGAPLQNGKHVEHHPYEALITTDHSGQDGSLRGLLRRVFSGATYLHGVTDAADLFDCGLDSLQLPGVVNEINAFLIKWWPQADLICNKTIYDYPSIEKLLIALNGSVDDGDRVKLTITNGSL